jgi:hypothetical protein
MSFVPFGIMRAPLVPLPRPRIRYWCGDAGELEFIRYGHMSNPSTGTRPGPAAPTFDKGLSIILE